MRISRILFVALALSAPAPLWPSAALATEPNPDALLAHLPMLGPEDSQRIYVDLAPEGRKPSIWMLDTGANVSIMTPSVARAAGVSIRRQKNDPYRIKSVLGRDIQFYVDVQASDTGSRTGFEYGLLGGSFLDAYVVEFDFERRWVRFYDKKKYQVPEHADSADERVIPMWLTARRPGVEIEFDGRPLRVLFDTGAPFYLLLSGAAAEKVGVDVESLPVRGALQTVKGQTQARTLETDRFRFAGFDFGRVPVIVVPRGTYNQGDGNDSVIGVAAMSRFRIVLDYPRKRILLQKQAGE